MKTLILSTLILSATFLIQGCNNNTNPDIDKSTPPPYYTPENYTGLEMELQKAEFSCATQNACPKSVGLIFSNIDGNVHSPTISQCTGFLVAEDIVATNSHCIPNRLKTPNSSCDAQIAIRFVESSGAKNIFTCKEIINYSSIGTFDPDYAFFKIEKTSREPLLIHQNGVKDKEPIQVAKITPLIHSIGGILEVESCKVGLGTLLNLKSTNSWSKIAVGLGCQGINGNSGSPVLNDEGKVVGILQSKMTKEYKNYLENTFKTFNIKFPTSIAPHILFTNLSCVADPETGNFNKEKCLNGEKLSFLNCISFNNEKTQANIKDLYDKWKTDLPTIFVYEFITEEATFTTEAQPICVKPKAKYADYSRFVTLNGFIGFRKEHLKLSYPHAVTIAQKFTINDEFRLDTEIKFSEKSRSVYNIDLVKNQGKWTGTTSIYRKSNDMFGFNNSEMALALPECSDLQLNSEEISRFKKVNGELVTSQQFIEHQDPKEKMTCEK